MYEIKIKGKQEALMVDDKQGKMLKHIYLDDQKYPDTQKIDVKNWSGTKGELKSVFFIEDSSAHSATEEINFSDADLRMFWESILPFTEKRLVPFIDDGSTFDYLTREGEVLFLEKQGVLTVDDRSKLLQYRITNPNGFLGLRDKIAQVHRMHGRQEYAEKKRMQELEAMAEKIGIFPA